MEEHWEIKERNKKQREEHLDLQARRKLQSREWNICSEQPVVGEITDHLHGEEQQPDSHCPEVHVKPISVQQAQIWPEMLSSGDQREWDN